jgi:hypothetical protein
MSNYNITARWVRYNDWYWHLYFNLTNNSPAALLTPEINVQLAKNQSCAPYIGYKFTQDTVTLKGVLLQEVLPVAVGATVEFAVGVSILEINSPGPLPVMYWVDGEAVTPAAEDTVAPTAPGNFTVNEITATTLSLSWVPSTDNVSVDDYLVYYYPQNKTVAEALTVATKTAKVTLNNLSPNTNYYVEAKARDAQGNISPASSKLSVTTINGSSTTADYAAYIDVSINATWSPAIAINTQYAQWAINNNVDELYLSFLCYNTTKKELVWVNDNFSYDYAKPVTDMLNQTNTNAVIAFGGAKGIDPSYYVSVETLTSMYQQVLRDFHSKHIDLNFEGGTKYNKTVAFKAAAAVQAADPSVKFSLTLQINDNGLRSEALAMVEEAKNLGVTFDVQIMTMCFARSNVGQASINVAEKVYQQLAALYKDKKPADVYAMIVMVEEIGQNGGGQGMGIFTFADSDLVSNYVKSKGMKKLAIWALNRDFPGDVGKESPTASGDPEQTQPYEFSKRFLADLH